MSTRQHYTILCISNHPQERATYCRYLQQAKNYTYKFLEADSANSAFSLCRQSLPDAILLDFALANGDGLRFLKTWFDKFPKATVPVVVLTEEANEQIIAKVLKQRAADYQSKINLTAEGLNESIIEVIKKFQLQNAEDRLREQEKILQLFVQYAPAGIAMFDKDMHYLMASQQWIEAYNLGPMEAILSRSHYDIFPEIPEHWRQVHQRCLAGATEKCEDELFVRADGSKQWISWEIRPWYQITGEIGGIIIFSLDVTPQKQAEIALQELNAQLEKRVEERTDELKQANEYLAHSLDSLQQSQEQTEDLYNNAPCGYHSLDQEGIIVHINNTELNWLGYSRDEVLNKKHYTDFLDDEGKRIFRENFPRLKHQGWIKNLEFELIGQNESSRWVSANATVVKDGDGKFLMTRTTLFDISDCRLAEQALQHQFQQQNLFLIISQAIRQSFSNSHYE